MRNELRGFPQIEVRSAGPLGRGVFATRTIKTGEILLQERPLLFTLEPSQRDQMCHTCLDELPDDGAEECSCHFEQYCSAACRKLAWGSWHGPMCGALLDPNCNRDVMVIARWAGLRIQHPDRAAVLETLDGGSRRQVDAPSKPIQVLAAALTHESVASLMASARAVVAGFDNNCFRLPQQQGAKVGNAVFAIGSNLNHSCEENADWSITTRSPGGTLHVTASRDIVKDEQVG